MVDIVVLGYVRVPIGKFGGAYRDVSAAKLAAYTIRKLLERTGVEPGQVDEVVFGSAMQGGQGQNLSRSAALMAGMSPEVSAYTVNRVCSSGMQAIIEAYRELALGDAQLVIAGGVDTMSHQPLALPPGTRWGVRHLIGSSVGLMDLMVYDGLLDPTNGKLMGEEAEMVAREHGITREELDAVAYQSHRRAWEATERGWFTDMEPFEWDSVRLDRDEGIRPDVDPEKLSRLRPAFRPDGVLTAGNSSQLSDGAAALLLARGDAADRLGVRPVARIVGYSWHMVEPWRFVEAPIGAVRKLLAKVGWSVSDVDYFENNEAFAVNNVLMNRALGVPYDRLNVFGGAIALGHPLGASGARIVTTLISVLRVKGGRRGVASICHGTGGATALALELS